MSFPKFGHGALAFVALAPLLIALPGAGGWRALRLGWLAGAVSALGVLYWTSLVVTQFGGLRPGVGIVVMALLCVAFAIFPTLFAWIVWRWSRAFGSDALLMAPLAWVATEVLRSYTFFRFPWCLLGYSQADNPAFIQGARFGAVYAVSFLLASTSAVLAYLAVERDRRRRLVAVAAGSLLLSAALADGLLRLGRPWEEAGRIRVGLVQAAIAQDEKWDEARALENLARHVTLARESAAQGARLVVWPESAVPAYFDWNPPLAAELRQLAADTGTYLFFGNDDRESEARVFVGAKLLTPSGELALRYHKIRLVPFGEYVPLQPLLTLGGRVSAKLVQQVADFTPGVDASVGEVEGHRIGGFICYEAIFPDLVRRFAAHGAELLVNVTNDAWYGRTSAPYQHFAMARFRAVENGRFLVRAANTGITAVVDPRGRVVARTELFERRALVAEVPFVREQTFYSRHGDVFGWGCVGAALVLSATLWGRPKRAA